MMVQAPKPKPDAARNVAANFSTMAEKSGATVPAAWPSGLSHVSQAYGACRRCEVEQACADWLERAPNPIQLPPGFCPNGAEFARLNEAKVRR